MAKKKTHEEFVKEVQNLVGDEYEVLGSYKTNKTKILMKHNSDRCNHHQFYIVPNSFLSGTRCPECAKLKNAEKRKMTHDEFVRRVRDIWGDEYTVLGNYVNSRTKVLIRHNSDKCGFSESYMIPNNILRGASCLKCSYLSKRKKLSLTHDEFLNKLREIYNDEYTPLEEYKNYRTKILIRHNCDYCNNHEFYTMPNNILGGCGCPKCKNRRISEKLRMSHEEFVERVKSVAPDYSVVGKYINFTTKVLLRHESEDCDYHEFMVTPANFFGANKKLGSRCPRCVTSKGEKKIAAILDELNIKYETEYRFSDCKNKKPLPFDFAVFDDENNLILLIEYQGRHHYEPVEAFGGDEHLKSVKNNDLIKKQYCIDNNIKLIEIPYWEFDNIENIIKEELREDSRNVA